MHCRIKLNLHDVDTTNPREFRIIATIMSSPDVDVNADVMKITKCSKTIRTLSNGVLTTDLHKTVMMSGTVQTRLKLRFVRNIDSKTYSTIRGDSNLLATIGLETTNPSLISEWLPSIQYVIPLTRECVLFFSHKDNLRSPILFVLNEEVDSGANQEDRKMITELNAQLSAARAETAIATAELADLRQKCGRITAKASNLADDCEVSEPNAKRAR